MKLTGKQIESLTNALVGAFATPQKMAQLLRFGLDKNIHTIATGENLFDVTFAVITTAISEGWIKDLILAALASNKGNTDLHNFAVELGISSTVETPQLEKLIRSSNPFLDVHLWCEKLLSIERQICRLEICCDNGDIFYGTGFLVGPSLLLTNFHVIEPVYFGQHPNKEYVGGTAKYNDVTLLFDYKILKTGEVLCQGLSYKLSEEWLVDFSDYVTSPLKGASGSLDYALIALDMGDSSTNHERLWIEMPSNDRTLKQGDGLMIMQHPEGEPLKLIIESDAIVKVSSNGELIEHRANTMPGSSGSPCFDLNWNLCAIHHGAERHNLATSMVAVQTNLQKNGIPHLGPCK